VPQIGISIEMETDFRLDVQPFSNVFHYKSIVANPAAAAPELVTEIVGIMRDLHSTAVRFKKARVWTSGGNTQENNMIYQTNLSGTGNQALVTAFDRERAVLMQWPAGTSITGKPVKLRKWFHSCGRAALVAFNQAALENTGDLSREERDLIKDKANQLRLIGDTDQWLLCAESGREHTAPGDCHRFLEHRQLGDQWRS
jgi:hypothetical protein